MLAGSLCGGCSFTYQLGDLFSKKEDDKPDYTATVSPTRAPSSEASPESDLLYARAAATELLAREKDASAPWSNPRTGARGTVMPLATAYTQDGQTCRDFLTSYVRQGSEAWLQGEACRVADGGKWEVRKLKPWKRS